MKSPFTGDDVVQGILNAALSATGAPATSDEGDQHTRPEPDLVEQVARALMSPRPEQELATLLHDLASKLGRGGAS